MSRYILHTQQNGTPYTLAFGFDLLGVVFLDVYSDQEDPVYESMFMHPAGLSSYGLPDLYRDLTRLGFDPAPVFQKLGATEPLPAPVPLHHMS